MSHNQILTGLILAAILALSSFLLFRIFFGETQESSSSPSLNDGADIEATLKKILSQTATLTPPTEGAAAVPASPEQAVEVEKLRAEITANQNLITELKTKATSGAADATPELLAKIKVLEDRLLEYEIIEDDIADLSIYKEENAKLKRELEALKGPSGEVLKNDDAAAAIDAVAAKPSAPTPTPAPEPTPAPVDPGQVQTAVSAPVDAPVSQAAAPAAAPMTPPSAAAVAAVAAADPGLGSSTTVASTENVKGSSDVFAEFQGDSNADILAGLGDLDADRMLEEIKDLGDAGGADAGVLDEDVDLEKMAKETSNKG